MSRWKTVGRFLDRFVSWFWVFAGPILTLIMIVIAGASLTEGVWWFEDGLWPWWLYAFGAYAYWQWFFIGSLRRLRRG